MKTVLILNDAPYGTERTYNGLRFGLNLLSKVEGAEVTVFLMGDAVASAKAGQQTPDGYYNVERMLKPIIRRGSVIACRTCLDARGLKPEDLVEGVRVVTLGEAAQLALEADKTLVY